MQTSDLAFRRATAMRLRVAMARRPISAVDLARRVGVIPNTVVRWRAGERIPPAWHLPAIAAALDIEPGDLIPSLAELEAAQAGGVS